ncbi:MAG TPA: protease complex subunit PrcB family protein [Kofleriaceae bacterium]|nr:protease complex subunit PrcB family protein [Kofleriaceae bacterium]
MTIACFADLAIAQYGSPREVLPITRLRPGPTAYTTYSGLDDAVRTVVRDSAQWNALWQTIARPFYPAPPMPQVDFDRDMVVVAALGARPSSGYDIVIEGAQQDTSSIEIALRTSSPAPGCPVTAAITQPVDLATIPTSPRPVRFRERSFIVPCGAP